MTEISLRDVTKVFGTNPSKALELVSAGFAKDAIRERTGQTLALREVTLEIATGEIFVIMGLSGCGKSTLLRLVNRLVEPTSGQVLVGGEDLAQLSDASLRGLRRHRIGMVFQRFGLFPHRSVIGNVAYGLEVQGLPRAERGARCREWIATVGLSGYEDAALHELSGGMQQRVGLARALATDPGILLMDEPFSALDPMIRREMQDELIALQTRLSKTIVFVTHDMSEALYLGDRIAVLSDGSVEQVGTPGELLDAPATAFVEAFLRSAERRLRN